MIGHVMRIDGQPTIAPVRYAAQCTCDWTSGYYHRGEIGGRLVDILQDAHHTHRKLRRRTTN